MSDRPSILGPLAPKQDPSKEDFKAGCVAILCFLAAVAIVLAVAYWNYKRFEDFFSR